MPAPRKKTRVKKIQATSYSPRAPEHAFRVKGFLWWRLASTSRWHLRAPPLVVRVPHGCLLHLRQCLGRASVVAAAQGCVSVVIPQGPWRPAPRTSSLNARRWGKMAQA